MLLGLRMEFPAEAGQTVLTNEQLLDLGDDILGMKVVVNTRHNALMGVVNWVLPANRRLTIGKLSDPKTGSKLIGMRHYDFSEIVNMVVVGVDKKLRESLLQDIYKEEKRGKQLLMKKLVLPHVAKLVDEPEIDEDILLGRVGYGSDDRDRKQNGKEVPLPPPPPPPPKVQRPEKFIIIDSIEDAFKKAIMVINSEKDISIALEGLRIGRAGTLAWLAVATSRIIFLFDMVKMGPSDAFKAGLTDILMDETILKILHDCRPVEDMLHHQFKINLKNVFDTQAAEVYLHMVNHKDSVPVYVSGLPSLLIRYLKLSEHHIFFPHVREECLENDESIWFERPLSNSLCEGLARRVMYLRELRLVLTRLMLVDLMQITDLHLGSFRDKDSTTVSNLEPHIVPAEVQKLRRRRNNNSILVHDPYIAFSKDAFRLLKKK